MKLLDAQGRTLFAGQVVSVAGTLLLAAPAVASHHNHDGQSMRQLRANNPGLSGQALRSLMQDQNDRGGRHAPNIEYQPVTRHHFLPTTSLPTAHASRMQGQSQFINDRGRERALARGLELDLSSTNRSITLGGNLFADASSYAVNVGGENKVLTSGSKVSAAEFVALQQVIDGGNQSLVVDGSGRAVDGQFTLASIDDAGRNIHAKSLVVPASVDAIGNFGRGGEFRLTGALVNNGNVFASADQSGIASIAARDITNNSNASIASSVDLKLAADRDLNNYGSISSAGSLTMSAGNAVNNAGSVSAQSNVSLQTAQVNNIGSITSLNGNIDFSTASPSDIVVNNTGGSISAMNGSINFRTPDFVEKYDTTLAGGDWQAQRINLNAGDGHLHVNVNDIAGGIYAHAGTAIINANAGTLDVEELVTSGDPLISGPGLVILGSASLTGSDLSVVAGGDIQIQPGAVVDTDTTSGAAGDILLIAGAAFTTNPTNIQVTGVSATGGNINYSGGAPTFRANSTSGDGGNITIAAFSTAGPTNGQINLSGSSLISNGSSGANNGNVLVIGGNNISLGSIDTKGPGTLGTGNITISARQPQVIGTLQIDSATGTVLSGSLAPDTSGSPVNISLGGAIDGGGQLSLDANSVTLNTISSGSVRINALQNVQTLQPISTTSGSLVITTPKVIDIRADVTAPGGILFVAGQSVTTTNAITLSTSTTGNAGDITLVAGAAYTQDATSVTITGSSNLSGRIDIAFPAVAIDTRSTGGNGNGGNLTMVALRDTFGAQGSINTADGTDIFTGGSGSGTNGNIVEVADGGGGIAFRGDYITSGGLTGTGDITMSCTNFTAGSVVLAKSNASVFSGTFLGGSLATGGIFGTTSGTLQTQGGDVTLISGRTGSQAIDTQNASIQAINGAVRMSADNIGDMRLGSIQAGSLVVTAGGTVDFRASLSTASATTSGGILIVAGRDIVNINAGDSLSTSASVSSGNITLVAGATYTEQATTITVTGSSNLGGGIDTSQMTAITSSSSGVSGTGGNINLIAFADNFGSKGTVFVGGGTIVSTGGTGAGSNGNISIVAGQNQNFTGINVPGTLDTTGGATGTGTIGLLTAQPSTPVAVSKSTADISSGSFTTGPSTLAGLLGAGTTFIHTDGTTFSATIGGAIDLTNTTVHVGSAYLSAGTFIQGIETITSTGSIAITAQGSISLRNTLTAPAGITIVAGGSISNVDFGDQLDTSTFTGNAGNITLVAGAAFTETAGTITITGNSGLFGPVIDLFNSFGGLNATSNGGNGNGGKVTLIAFADNTGAGGRVGVGGPVLTGGNGSGTNGDIVIIGGANDGNNSASLSGLLNTAGTSAGSGDITIASAVPLTGSVISKSDASYTLTFVGGAPTNGGIFMNSPSQAVLNSADVFINSGQVANLQPIDAGVAGNIYINAGLLGNGTATIRTINSGTLSVTSPNLIDLRGFDIVTALGTILVSGGNITNNGGSMQINTSNGTGDAGNMILVAGAAFTQNSGSITITGNSTTGGNIDLNNSFSGLNGNSTGGGGDGGQITLVSYADASGANGNTSIGSTASVFAGGDALGSNGDVLFIGSNNQASESVTVQGPVTVSGGVTGTGSISLKTVQPGVGVVINRNTITQTGTFDSNTPVNSGVRSQTTLSAPGGDINILSGRNAILNTLDVHVAGTGDGGNITIETNGTFDFQIGTAGNNGVNNANFNGGSAGGNGGTLTVISNNNNLGINVQGTSLQPSVVSGNGAGITLDSGTGPIIFNNPSPISANGAGAGNNGGTIDLTANNFVFNTGNMLLQANGVGAGLGGSISITTPQAIGIGPGATQFSLQANGGNSTVTLNSTGAGVDLTVPLTFTNLNLASFNAPITQTATSPLNVSSLNIGLNGASPGTADFASIVNLVGQISGSGGGTILLDNGASNLFLGALGATQTLVASTTGSMSTVSNITTTGDITLNTPDLTNNFAMSANSISVISQGASNLTVTGTGTFNATGGGQEVTFDTNADMTVGGTFHFISVATMTLNNPGHVFTVAALANIVGQQLTTVNVIGCTVNQIGNISGNPLIFNFGGGGGGGTIANSIGDVTLSGNLIFVGTDIAVIAAGNITGSSGTQINLSSIAGAGGSLTMLAGFNFTPPTPGQVTDSTTTFTNFTPNTTGGSMNLSGVTLNTSSGSALGSAGNILLVANGGTSNNGSITTGDILATSGGGVGGAVRVFGGNNISLGNLDSSGSTGSGLIDIRVATPVVTGVPQVFNGTLSGGNFTGGALRPGNVTVGTIDAGNNLARILTTGSTSTILVGNSVTANAVQFDAGPGSLDLHNLGNITTQQDFSGNGGSITLVAQKMTFNSSAAHPFALHADGLGTGNGGTILVRSGDTVPVYIGTIPGAKSGNFLTVTAVSGTGAGAAGGAIDFATGGSLAIDTTAFDAGPKGTGASDGATYSVESGRGSSKGGTLQIFGNLSSAGINGGVDHDISLTSNSSTVFSLNPSKTPKSGIVGKLDAGLTGEIDIFNLGGGIQVETFDAMTADTIELVASGKGGLDTAPGAFVLANHISLESSLGAIGKKQPFAVNTADLFIGTNGTANVTTTGAGLLTLQDSFANKGFSLSTIGPVILNDITTTAGDINVFACTQGTLTVAAGAVLDAHNGALSLINGELSNGDILLDTGSIIKTSGKGDDVVISIGTPPKKPTNMTSPGNILLDPQGKGAIYFEPTAGVVALGAQSTVRAINKRVIFSNISNNAAKKITLNGNVLIVADPPSRSHVVSMSLPMTSATLDSNETSGHLQSDENLINGSTYQNISLIPTDVLKTSTISETEQLGGSILPLAAEERSTARTISGITDAYVWCDEELGLDSALVLHGAAGAESETESASLRKGTIVLAPSKNTRLDTPMGSIELAKDSVALVVLDDSRLAVYDLHDSKRNSVRVTSGSRSTVLSPGRCAVLTKKTNHAFEHVNPIESIGYKSLDSRHHGNGVKSFTAEFSTVSAINSVKPLRALFTSNRDAAKRMSSRLMKTTAVLLQLSTPSEFEYYCVPNVTAMHR